MEQFQIIRPSAILAPYIKHYWFLTADDIAGSPQRIIPTGNMSLVLHRGETMLCAHGRQAQPQAFLTGQSTGYCDLVQRGAIDMISITFRPHGARAFFPIPSGEFLDSSIPIDELGEQSLKELHKHLMDTPDIRSGVALIEAFFLKRLNVVKSYNHDRMQTVMRSIDTGMSDIGQLAGLSCLSYKQFKRVFFDYVGTNPGDFLRVVRFQKALHIMQTRHEDDLIQVAYESGYYDQPHMNKDFKRFSGYTPGEFISVYSPYSDYFA